MKKILLLTFISLLVSSVSSQEVLYNRIYDGNIKTVLMYIGGDDMSQPIWDLGSSKKLTLSFDDVNADTRDFKYTIIHCNLDWAISDLDKSEFIEGYFEDQISEFQTSFNTTINFTHYKLSLPNEYIRPTISGNYVLRVYESSDPENILFDKRFMVVERNTNIEATVKNMNQGSYFYNNQELEIKVEYFGNEFYDITENIKVQVLKNYDWGNAIQLNRPDAINGQEFIYNNFNVLKFKGGNEFHHFNTKNIHYAAENIRDISFVDNMYHFLLVENKDITFEEYQIKPDINGKFKIDVTQSEYPETEADYSYVYFTLNMDAPMQQGEVYLYGALTNYEFNESSIMKYNYEQKAYECRLQLKQGYYNYKYVTIEKGKVDYTYIDGNHSQTENQYTILVYYHDYRGNYDRLIGVGEVNSKQ